MEYRNVKFIKDADLPKATPARFLPRDGLTPRTTTLDEITNGHWSIKREALTKPLIKRAEGLINKKDRPIDSSTIWYSVTGESVWLEPLKYVGLVTYQTITGGVNYHPHSSAIYQTESGEIVPIDPNYAAYITGPLHSRLSMADRVKPLAITNAKGDIIGLIMPMTTDLDEHITKAMKQA